MIEIVLYFVVLGMLVVVAVILHLWYAANTIGTDITLFKKGWDDFDCIAVHTYCPTGETENLPLRGRLTIHQAYLLASRSQKPILLAVGNTVPGDKRMESEIYASFLRRVYGFTNVVLGDDPDARDTAREAAEMHRLCEAHGFKTVMRFGSRPHLARISWYWNRVNGGSTWNYFKTIFWHWFPERETLKTYYVGVYVPAYLYFFEVPFFLVDMALQFVELYLPKWFSKGLRNLMLNILNRKG